MLKISLITPSFNQGQFIKATIDSVLSQKYQNLEYWVVDGGSTDNTISILKSYGKKINWISQKDDGQTSAINWGLSKCTGDIIGFINSDDLLLPFSLEKVGLVFEKKQCDWLIGNYAIIDTNGQLYKKHTIVEKYKQFLLKHFSKNLLLSVNNFIPQPSTFWSKKAFRKVGFLDETLHYTMDYDYWLRLAKYFKPVVKDQHLSQFRIHPQSKSMSNRKKMLSEELLVAKKQSLSFTQQCIHQMHTLVVAMLYKIMD